MAVACREPTSLDIRPLGRPPVHIRTETTSAVADTRGGITSAGRFSEPTELDSHSRGRNMATATYKYDPDYAVPPSWVLDRVFRLSRLSSALAYGFPLSRE